MPIVTIDRFIAGLCAIPEEDFKIGTVYDYVKAHPVDGDSLHPYLYFSHRHYTRNLIFRNGLFELLAICWESGQVSAIHNHHNQNCWMVIPIGRLRVQNFRVLQQDDETGYCRLEPTDSFDIDRFLPAEVDPSEPVHQVSNLSEFDQRAVSLHIYSRPLDRCLVYSPDQNLYTEVELENSSEYGKLC